MRFVGMTLTDAELAFVDRGDWRIIYQRGSDDWTSRGLATSIAARLRDAVEEAASPQSALERKIQESSAGVLQMVLDLHSPRKSRWLSNFSICEGCEAPYPCRTVRAIVPSKSAEARDA